MPELDLDTLKALAEEGVARHGLRGYARKLDLDVGTLRSLLDGRDIQTSRLLMIVSALGLSLDLRPGSTGAAPGRNGFSETDDARDSEALRTGYLPIPFHTVERAYDGAAPVALSAKWLADNGLDPQALYFVTAPDDAMAPLLVRGAQCLIDASVRRAGDHALWAYTEAGKLQIRYLSQPAPGTMVIAGTAHFAPPRVTTGPALDQITLIGRVVWHGQLSGPG